MMIEVNSDNNITGNERLNSYVSDTVSDALSRFSEQVMRVEVHLGDENSHKGGKDDKRCMIEARLAHMQPVAVTAHSDSIEQALHDAVDKLIAALDKAIGRLQTH
jgi:ribosome-associated translation inhibitor RaiA